MPSLLVDLPGFIIYDMLDLSITSEGYQIAPFTSIGVSQELPGASTSGSSESASYFVVVSEVVRKVVK